MTEMEKKSIKPDTYLVTKNVISKLHKHGIRESFSIFRSLVIRYVLLRRSNRDFMRIAGIRRELLGRRIYEESSGCVRYGDFKGLKLVSHRWGARDLGSIILGEYERNIVEYINQVDLTRTTFVDVGAADGFYAVGLLHNGRMKRSICFESSEDGRTSIGANASANGVQSAISIRGTASKLFAKELLDELGDELKNSVFLFDIEGGEFDLLTNENLKILQNSILIVELHKEAGDYERKVNNLYLNARDTHQIHTIQRNGANPFQFEELESWPDEDRQIVFSEGRRYSMTWIALHPRF